MVERHLVVNQLKVQSLSKLWFQICQPAPLQRGRAGAKTRAQVLRALASAGPGAEEEDYAVRVIRRALTQEHEGLNQRE